MRTLVCVQCLHPVEVDEAPVEFIDPRRFLCKLCRSRPQTSLLDDGARAPERHPYDPDLALIPF